MSGKNRSKSSTNTTNTSTVLNSAISGDVSGVALSNSTLDGVEIITTDHGAVAAAFDAFDTASGTVNNALGQIKNSSENTIQALKEFATQLTVGDIESSKWIAFAIIAAVVIALGLYFWLGKK